MNAEDFLSLKTGDLVRFEDFYTQIKNSEKFATPFKVGSVKNKGAKNGTPDHPYNEIVEVFDAHHHFIARVQAWDLKKIKETEVVPMLDEWDNFIPSMLSL